jgi:hypothetical protein
MCHEDGLRARAKKLHGWQCKWVQPGSQESDRHTLLEDQKLPEHPLLELRTTGREMCTSRGWAYPLTGQDPREGEVSSTT